jgi:hypothetical protein
MINAWSLAYDVINGTLDEHFPVKKKTMTTKTYPIKEDDMSPCKLEDIKITSLESDEYDPIVTVGSGNTASVSTDNTYYVDTTQMGEVKIDTSALDNEGITISAGDAFVNFDDITFIDNSNYETLNLNLPDDLPLDQNFLADNDDAAAHHFTTPGIAKDCTRKYKEDESIEALKNYISTTYNGHYTSKENNVQTLDLIESVGDAESFCRSNAIKYLSRYDKKGQAKRDILKALHYSLLLYHFSGQLNETPTRGYETF